MLRAEISKRLWHFPGNIFIVPRWFYKSLSKRWKIVIPNSSSKRSRFLKQSSTNSHIPDPQMSQISLQALKMLLLLSAKGEKQRGTEMLCIPDTPPWQKWTFLEPWNSCQKRDKSTDKLFWKANHREPKTTPTPDAPLPLLACRNQPLSPWNEQLSPPALLRPQLNRIWPLPSAWCYLLADVELFLIASWPIIVNAAGFFKHPLHPGTETHKLARASQAVVFGGRAAGHRTQLCSGQSRWDPHWRP